MNKIITDFIWNMVFGEEGFALASANYTYFNPMALLLPLNIEVIFRDFGLEFTTVRNVIYLMAYYLIILKFVKKILDVYALQTDGDANADIFVVITNFCKAMVIAMTFTTIWNWISYVSYDFGMKLVDSIPLLDYSWLLSSTGNKSYDMFFTMKQLGEMMQAAGYKIIVSGFGGLACLLMLLQLKNGVELWILRIGVPLACCGLLDADKGIFGQYMKVIWKAILTILIQMFLLNIGMSVIMAGMKSLIMSDGMTVREMGNMALLGCLACAILICAFFVPKMLGEFLLQKQGGGKVMQAVYMGSFLLRGVM